MTIRFGEEDEKEKEMEEERGEEQHEEEEEWQESMDELTIKTPDPICRLFFNIDLLTDCAALCLTELIGWRYIHSWLVLSTQIVNCCPHGQRNYTCVLLPLYFLSGLPPPPPPSQTKCTVYTDSVCDCGGGGGGEFCCKPYFTLYF